MCRGDRQLRPLALPVLILLALLCSASSLAHGQYAGTDLELASRYVWRGITRVNHPVIQAQAFGGFRTGHAFSTVGIWTDPPAFRTSFTVKWVSSSARSRIASSVCGYR